MENLHLIIFAKGSYETLSVRRMKTKRAEVMERWSDLAIVDGQSSSEIENHCKNLSKFYVLSSELKLEAEV